jgi:hypothetical protein
MSYKLALTKDHQIHVVVSSPKATLPVAVATFVEQIKSQASFSYSQAARFDEVGEHIPAEATGALIVLCIQDKDEFVYALQFLTSNEMRIQQGTLKILVFSRMSNPRVLSILKSKGVFDIPDFNISIKAFSYKVQKVVQMIEQSIENTRRATANGEQSAAIKAGRAGAGGRGSNSASFKVIWENPIEHFSDFWLLLNPKHARYVIGKWMINFYGPGPSSGTWELTPLEENGEKGWMFNPRVLTDSTFYQDAGRWVFFGNCPEFSWEQRIWYFISKRPALYFYSGSEIRHKKIYSLESGDVQIHSNSDTGKSLKDAITSTIEASIRLQTDRGTKKGNAVFEQEIAAEFDFRDTANEVSRSEETFESSELQINITSKNGQKVESHDPIRLVELRETQAIIDIPVGLLVVGDQIEVDAYVQDGKRLKKVSFSASTRIVESDLQDGEPADQKRAAAICELDQSIKGHFTDVVDQLQAKREILDQFFKKAKGA